MSDLPTIVKLRYDLERWVNGRGGKIINKAVNVIDSRLSSRMRRRGQLFAS